MIRLSLCAYKWTAILVLDTFFSSSFAHIYFANSQRETFQPFCGCWGDDEPEFRFVIAITWGFYRKKSQRSIWRNKNNERKESQENWFYVLITIIIYLKEDKTEPRKPIATCSFAFSERVTSKWICTHCVQINGQRKDCKRSKDSSFYCFFVLNTKGIRLLLLIGMIKVKKKKESYCKKLAWTAFLRYKSILNSCACLFQVLECAEICYFQFTFSYVPLENNLFEERNRKNGIKLLLKVYYSGGIVPLCRNV